MTTYILQFLSFLLVSTSIGCSVVKTSAEDALAVPQSTAESVAPVTAGTETAVFAGGCFWGVEAVFEHVKGVVDVKSGYAGGQKSTADYETVSGGKTGHAESVLVTFDPAKVSYEQLLSVFFSVAHDPTELNYQGPDHGTQYRSAIFYSSDGQKKAAQDYIDQLTSSKVYSKPVVTQVTPLEAFYDAEKYHQNYLKLNPTDPYIVINDIPKVEALKKKYPDLYAEK